MKAVYEFTDPDKDPLCASKRMDGSEANVEAKGQDATALLPPFH